MSEPKVKVAFTAIIAFLVANADKKVKTILDEVIAMCSAKAGGGGGSASTFVRNAEGKVVAIRCFYHKVWMSPEVAEFGAKASSATGLNSMCKEGVSNWTKQQRDFKAAQTELLHKVSAGEVAPEAIGDAIEALNNTRNEVKPRADGYGFATAAEAIEDARVRGIDVGTVTTAEEQTAE